MICGINLQSKLTIPVFILCPNAGKSAESSQNSLTKTMDWRKLIHPNPKTPTSQPAAPQTRLSVEFVLGLFAAGWTEQQVLEKYPTLTSAKLRAALAAADSRLDQTYMVASKKTGGHSWHRPYEFSFLGSAWERIRRGSAS